MNNCKFRPIPSRVFQAPVAHQIKIFINRGNFVMLSPSSQMFFQFSSSTAETSCRLARKPKNFSTESLEYVSPLFLGHFHLFWGLACVMFQRVAGLLTPKSPFKSPLGVILWNFREIHNAWKRLFSLSSSASTTFKSLSKCYKKHLCRNNYTIRSIHPSFPGLLKYLSCLNMSMKQTKTKKEVFRAWEQLRVTGGKGEKLKSEWDGDWEMG